jgi:antirestriction protein ArdC
MARPQTTSPCLYDRVTTAILADLERGVRPWLRPWSLDHCGAAVSLPLRHTGEAYRGVNVLLLWAAAEARGYDRPTWMTFRQALALGGHVRKGERGATVVYAGQLSGPVTEDEAAAEPVSRSAYFLRAYTVFNLAQIEGLPEAPATGTVVSAPERIAAVEAFFAATGLEVRHGGGQAFYVPSRDYVQMPPLAAFADTEAYYATLAHEATHWTGHASRLARDLGEVRFGDPAYAREELVAELGAAFLCAELGLSLTPRTEHADYLGHWLAVLRADRRAIFSAASQAQRACDYLKAVQPLG